MLQKLISLPGNFSSSTVFIIPGRFITSQIIYSNKCTKNSVFIFLIHFHGGGFNFHHLNARFYTGETISIDFAYTIYLLKIARGKIECIINVRYGRFLQISKLAYWSLLLILTVITVIYLTFKLLNRL